MLQNTLDQLYDQQVALYDYYANYYKFSEITKDIAVRYNPQLNTVSYHIEDQLHRLDGPAIVSLDKSQQDRYFIYGEECSKDDYKEEIESIKRM